MMDWIETLEKYYEDIPADLKSEVRFFLDEYYEKGEKNCFFVEHLASLEKQELQNAFYLASYNEIPRKKDIKLIPNCSNIQILDVPTFALGNVKSLPKITGLKVLSLRNIFLEDMKIIKDILINNTNLFVLDLEFSQQIPISEIQDLISHNSLIFCRLTYDYIGIQDVIETDNKKTSIKFKHNYLIFLSYHLGLSKFDDITTLTELVYLDLSSNKIQHISSSIESLSKLKYLDVSRNEIKSISNKISRIKSLKYISIDYNKIENSPLFLLELPNLEELFLINNPYSNFSFLNDLRNVIYDFTGIDQLGLFRQLVKLTPKERIDNHNYFTLKIPKNLQTPMLQYIEFFKDYVEATKGKEIIFDIKRDEAGLILITNGNTGVTLPELGEYFQEYVNFVQQDLEKWIPNFDIPKTPLEADIFRSKMERQVNNLRSDLEIARIESSYLRDKVKDSETQIDFLKDLTKDLRHDIRLLIEGRTPETLNVDQLLLDIIDQAIRMLERRYSHGLEDLHNDILTEFLRQKGYNATDQTRSGRSKLGVGEIDIMIRKKNGTPFSIIEAFRLSSCGEDNKTVAAHLDKLVHDYDTAGHERNFIIVYAEAKNFEKLWENYQIYMNELNGKSTFRATYPLISFKEKADVSEKSSIKIGIAKHRREGAIVEIYHVFINMFGAKVG